MLFTKFLKRIYRFDINLLDFFVIKKYNYDVYIYYKLSPARCDKIGADFSQEGPRSIDQHCVTLVFFHKLVVYPVQNIYSERETL